MTPIHPDNRSRYPSDWKAISRRIRFERAHGRCECRGECGHDHESEPRLLLDHALLVVRDDDPAAVPAYEERGGRCGAINYEDHTVTGSRVVLTVAHLDHTPENCDDENLRAMCQRCHLAYDREHHAAERRRRSEDQGGQVTLW